MHTIMVIAGGFVLLALCLGGGWMWRGSAALGAAALAFLPIWLLLAAVNMWIGVSRAGYSVAAELPILGLVFGLPALVALVVWYKAARG